jgi:hypothetical protein
VRLGQRIHSALFKGTLRQLSEGKHFKATQIRPYTQFPAMTMINNSESICKTKTGATCPFLLYYYDDDKNIPKM